MTVSTVPRKVFAERERQADTRVRAEPSRERATEVPLTRCDELLELEHLIGNRAMTGWVQRKLEVGRTDDPAEREADVIAEHVIHHIQDHHQHDEVTPDPAHPGKIHRSGGVDAAGGTVDPAVEQRIREARVGGRPLGPGIRSQMEASFGADFADVRLHRDQAAADASRHISASAFTHGSHIFYGENAPSPATPAGRELLAHELTHTLQQGATRERGAGKIRRRFLQPSDDPKTWDDETKKKGKFGLITFKKKRSKKLKVIDAAVAEFHRARQADDDDRMRDAIEHVLRAIAQWRGSKKDAGAGSIRGGEVDELETEASGIRLQLDTTPVIPPPGPAPPTEPKDEPQAEQVTAAPAETRKPKPPRPDKSTRLPLAQNPAATQPKAPEPTKTKTSKPRPPRPDKSTRLPLAQNPAATTNKPKPKPTEATAQPGSTAAAVEQPSVSEESVPMKPQEVYGAEFTNLLARRISEGASDREIGWRLAWFDRTDDEGGLPDSIDDLFEDVRDDPTAYVALQNEHEAAVEKLAKERDNYESSVALEPWEIQATAELYWAGSSIDDAIEFGIPRTRRSREGEKEEAERREAKKQKAEQAKQAEEQRARLAKGSPRRLYTAKEVEQLTGQPLRLLKKKRSVDPLIEKLITMLKAYEAEPTPRGQIEKLIRAFAELSSGIPSDRTDGVYRHLNVLWIQLLTQIDRIRIRQLQEDLTKYYNLQDQFQNEDLLDKKKEFLAHMLNTAIGDYSKVKGLEWESSVYSLARHESELFGMTMRLERELADILTNDADLGGLSDEDLDESKSKQGADAGKLNQVDLVTYNIGQLAGSEDVDREQATFTGFFKALQHTDVNDANKERTSGIPMYLPGYHRRNLAMYELDKALGAGVIPKTFMTEHGPKGGEKQLGTVMEKVQGFAWSEAKNWVRQKDEIRRGVTTLRMLDMIAAQLDRHSDNYRVEMENGKIKGIKGIDNDMAFGKDYSPEMVTGRAGFIDEPGLSGKIKITDELYDIDQRIAERIVEVAKDPRVVQDALSGLLSSGEIRATVQRLQALAGFLEPLLKKKDGRIVSRIT